MDSATTARQEAEDQIRELIAEAKVSQDIEAVRHYLSEE
jgi:hypothetical protein